MFGLQPTDLIGILIVALLLFGPARLPQIGRALGSTMREFQNATREATQSFQEGVSVAEPGPEKKDNPVEKPGVVCRNCGYAIQPDMRFCPECGADQQAQVAAS